MTNTHTLTYGAEVDPAPGTLMGPGLDGRLWEVTGTVQTADGKSLVEVQEHRS